MGAPLNEAHQAMEMAKEAGVKVVFCFQNGDVLKSYRGVYKRVMGSYRKSASLSTFVIRYMGPNNKEYKSAKAAAKAIKKQYKGVK
jgi:hypothetical protein